MRLWYYLRSLDAKFRRQEPIARYIADFCCYEARLVVEVDGVQHGQSTDYDQARDAELAALGFETLRIPAWEVMANIDGVLQSVNAAVRRRIHH